MLKHEFEELTGFHPTESLYQVIEDSYYNFNGDKKAFCEAYKENRDGLASKIQREADIREIAMKCDLSSEIVLLKDRIAYMQKKANEFAALIGRVTV